MSSTYKAPHCTNIIIPIIRVLLLKLQPGKSKILSKSVESNRPPKVSPFHLSCAGHIGREELPRDSSSHSTDGGQSPDFQAIRIKGDKYHLRYIRAIVMPKLLHS